MSQSTNSVCKLCRREGVKLFLKGERCFSDKCSFERRPYPPGESGSGRIRFSEFGLQLREKQKLRRMYLLSEQQFRRFFQRSVRKKGVKGLNFLRMLELRLDSICLKSGFANSIKQARRLVNHGHLLVNGKRVTIPSYQCRVGDVIGVREKSKEKLAVKDALENAKRKTRPEWLGFEEAEMKSRVSRLPERDDINMPINERYVVELYSK